MDGANELGAIISREACVDYIGATADDIFEIESFSIS